VASVATGGGDVAMRRLTPDDAGWAAGLLARRRARLVPYAPVYWRPAQVLPALRLLRRNNQRPVVSMLSQLHRTLVRFPQEGVARSEGLEPPTF
jgi:hypothetical protein